MMKGHGKMHGKMHAENPLKKGGKGSKKGGKAANPVDRNSKESAANYKGPHSKAMFTHENPMKYNSGKAKIPNRTGRV